MPASLLCHTLDAAMTASLRPRRSFGEQVRCMLSARSSGYERVAAAVNALDRLVPGAARRATALICGDLRLPFAAEHVELLAFGSGATVFLVRDGAAAARVVKVYRRTIGARRDRLPALLESYRRQYEEVREIFAGAPGVVWPSEYLVIEGPILERPAVACVQDHIAGPMRDLFTDMSVAEILEATAVSSSLRRQLAEFARLTMALHGAGARCPDFLGHRNLSVAGEGAEARLRLIDYRLFALPAGGASGLEARLKPCIQRMEELAGALR
jgi:hypothetical protein